VKLAAEKKVLCVCLSSALTGMYNAIGRVRPSVRLFPLYLLNRLTFDLVSACIWVTITAWSALDVKVVCLVVMVTRIHRVQ